MSGVDRVSDLWRWRRIAIFGAIGGGLAEIQHVLDYWPVSGAPLRKIIDIGQFLVLPIVALFLVILVLLAILNLAKRRFRSSLSSLAAICAVPAGFAAAAALPVFDPWLYYAVANARRFESDPSGFQILEEWDVSTGIAGANENHFIMLVFDRSDEIGFEPEARSAAGHSQLVWPTEPHGPLPSGRRLFRHLFLVDLNGRELGRM